MVSNIVSILKNSQHFYYNFTHTVIQIYRKCLVYFITPFLIISSVSYAQIDIEDKNYQQKYSSIFQNSVNNKQGQNQLLQLNRISTLWRLSFDSITMPDGKESMGLLGLYYLAKINSLMNGGIVGYGAIMGDQGGLFVLGIQGEIDHSLFSKFWIRSGVFVGGGGGKVGTGNGSMVRSHIGIAYAFDRFKVGSHYSFVSFLNSNISDNQYSLSLTIPTQFYYANPDFSGKKINNFSMVRYISSFGEIVFNHIYMGIIIQNYFQKFGTKNTIGHIQDNTISLIGVEFGRFITKKTFIFLKTAGALKGNPHGYMDFLAGFGYSYPLTEKYFSLLGKISAGSGGGGHVETGGGLLLETNIGLKLNFTPNIAMQIDGGFLNSPSGHFQAVSLSSKLHYSIEIADIVPTKNAEDTGGSYKFKAWAIRITNLIYRTPKRTNNIANDNVHLICLKFDKYLSNHFFITGQAHSAYAGKFVGGYAAGMIGAGMQSKGIFDDQIKSNVEFLIGAGGGGHLALGEGSIAQSMAGVTFNMNDYIIVLMSIGKVFSLNNDLSSTVIDLGLAIHFSTLTRRIITP